MQVNLDVILYEKEIDKESKSRFDSKSKNKNLVQIVFFGSFNILVKLKFRLAAQSIVKEHKDKN